jgi:hypothetical protein
MTIWIIVIIAIIALPIIALVVRMRRGEESAPGGSMGDQMRDAARGPDDR